MRRGGARCPDRHRAAGEDGRDDGEGEADRRRSEAFAETRRHGTFDVIFCRNVLIYFDRDLQNRVHALFYDSLAMFGVLALTVPKPL